MAVTISLISIIRSFFPNKTFSSHEAVESIPFPFIRADLVTCFDQQRGRVTE